MAMIVNIINVYVVDSVVFYLQFYLLYFILQCNDINYNILSFFRETVLQLKIVCGVPDFLLVNKY